MNDQIWGIDLGGTKIEGVVLEKGNYKSPIIRERIDTQADKGYEHIIKRVHELVEMLKTRTQLSPQKIGFGTPGILDRSSKLMKNCNTTCLNNRALDQDLSKTLGVEAILANDANCFALAESLFGSGRNANSVFGIIMGTGVGGGIVLNGRIHSGLHGIAGEWGHNSLLENGDPCYCGKNGCVEKVLSGPSLEKYYQSVSGKSLKLKEILAGPQDQFTQLTLQRLTKNFAKAVSVVINILDPEVIVVGGGLSNIDALYNEGIAEISQHIFNNKVSTKIVRNELGDSAGVFGAALLCNT